MAELTLEVHPRESTGTGASKRLRREGLLPAVVYGGGKDPVAIQMERGSLQEILKIGENAVFLLKLGDTGKSRHTMVRHLDVDPITRKIRHVDFQRIDLSETVRVAVQLVLVGESPGVKNSGGVLDFITREIEVECLPTKIPANIEVDVSELEIGDHLEVKDLDVPEGVEPLVEADRVIASVSHSRVAEEVAEFEEGLESAETLLEAEVDEPEVIGKTAEDDEEGTE